MKFASAFAILLATTASLTTMVSGENVHGEERQLASGNGDFQGNGKGEPRNSVILFEAELEEDGEEQDPFEGISNGNAPKSNGQGHGPPSDEEDEDWDRPNKGNGPPRDETPEKPNGEESGGPPGQGNNRPCKIRVGGGSPPGLQQRSANAPSNFKELPSTCDDGDEITIELPNGKTKKFQKERSTKPRGQQNNKASFWSGQDKETGSSFNFIRASNGVVAGSYTDLVSGDVYRFGIDAKGDDLVRVTPTSMFPDELDPEDDDEDDPLARRNRALLRGGSGGANSDIEDVTLTTTTTTSRRKLQVADTPIDVMVPWTKRSECRNAGLAASCTVTETTRAAMRAMIELAIAETNNAYFWSGVHAELRLVHAYRESSYVETSFSTALLDLRVNGDGIMDNVHTLRNTHNADVVAMIIDNGSSCGLGRYGPSYSNMFSVTHWDCATGYYSFGHEIG